MITYFKFHLLSWTKISSFSFWIEQTFQASSAELTNIFQNFLLIQNPNSINSHHEQNKQNHNIAHSSLMSISEVNWHQYLCYLAICISFLSTQHGHHKSLLFLKKGNSSSSCFFITSKKHVIKHSTRLHKYILYCFVHFYAALSHVFILLVTAKNNVYLKYMRVSIEVIRLNKKTKKNKSEWTRSLVCCVVLVNVFQF